MPGAGAQSVIQDFDAHVREGPERACSSAGLKGVQPQPARHVVGQRRSCVQRPCLREHVDGGRRRLVQHQGQRTSSELADRSVVPPMLHIVRRKLRLVLHGNGQRGRFWSGARRSAWRASGGSWHGPQSCSPISRCLPCQTMAGSVDQFSRGIAAPIWRPHSDPKTRTERVKPNSWASPNEPSN